jgi:molybdopterin molybdotransferase
LDESIAGLQKGLSEADIILLTGAVSRGEFDYLPEAFRQCGLETHFDELSVKPGKPTTFASIGHKLIFGLPGNPVSSFLMFHIFVKPALYIIQGFVAYPRPIKCELGAEYKGKRSDRLRLLPGKLDTEGKVIPLEYHGSGHLLSLSDADGFIEIDGESTSIPPGTRLTFWPLMMRGYQGVVK